MEKSDIKVPFFGLRKNPVDLYIMQNFYPKPCVCKVSEFPLNPNFESLLNHDACLVFKKK
jgi:hypothetical protein